MSRRTITRAMLASLASSIACIPHAFAQQSAAPPATREGTVIALDAGDLVVDFGVGKGAYEGQVVELWRPMRVKHPVTGQIMTDRFRIGHVTLSQVQPKLSLARVDDKLLRPPAAGDVVIASQPRTAAPAPTQLPGSGGNPPPKATAASSGIEPIVWADPEAKELSDLFTAVQGWTPEARAAAYDKFVTKHPRSRFVRVLREEAAALRARGTTAAPDHDARPVTFGFSFDPFDRLRPGQPQRVAVELDPRFVGGLVHVRKKGDASYRSLKMERVGVNYWAATLPGDATDDPGMEYFIEGVPKEGPAISVVGTPSVPKDVDVEQRPFVGKKPGTVGQFSVQSEYASFNAKRADDYLFQTEGNFGWRLSDTHVRAVRSGFGVFRGKGAPLAQLDAGIAPRDVGLTYGYVETEFGITPLYGFIIRPILGLREDGVSGGAQGFVRIGSDLRTNLLVGGEALGGVGLRGIVQLDWRTIRRVPIVFRSEVTNQPAGLDGDVGVRTIVQGGYEIVPELTAFARASYQGRTINHAGPGAGLGVSYQW